MSTSYERSAPLCLGCEQEPASLPKLYCAGCLSANEQHVLAAIERETAYRAANRRAAVLGLPQECRR